MDISVAAHDRRMSVLALRGQLDIDSIRCLQQALDPLLTAATPRIVIDLSGLTFCDSMGLSAFVTAQTHCANRGGVLYLASPTPFLSRVLTTVGLTDRLTIFPTVYDAVTAAPPV